MTDDLSRRQFFTEALPRGVGGLLRGAVQLRHAIHERASAGAAPLYHWATPNSELTELLRELNASTQRLRLEHPEWFPQDMPDLRDRDAIDRWIDEREERRRGSNTPLV